jgi:hypothetical protein
MINMISNYANSNLGDHISHNRNFNSEIIT